MARCECCEAPAVANCSGLDVPILWFCAEHIKIHEKNCLHIHAEEAAISWPVNKGDDDD